VCVLFPTVLAALPDTWIVGFEIFQLLFSAGLTLAVWKLSRVAGEFDDQDRKLHELATKLVDERFRAMTHEVNNHMQGLLNTIDELKSRLKDGDQTIDGLNERDQKIELAVAGKIDSLKDYIRDNTASKSDVRAHEQTVAGKFDRMGEKVEAMGREVAVLTSKVAKL
jgi:septation ring formation regulator EzrA